MSALDQRREAREQVHMLGAVLLSLLLHLAILDAVSYGQLGHDGGLGAQTGKRLDVSFRVQIDAAGSSEPPIGLQACSNCMEPQTLEQEPSTLAGDHEGLPRYWPLELLDSPPQPLTDIDLDTPDVDAVATIGKVELTLLIDEGGLVEEVRFADTEQPSGDSQLNVILAERFRSARFSPGKLKGRPVAIAMPITVVVEPR